ncbi:hypothetical protein [Microbulbifer sp. JMSA008]|uniref:hypothetical protein n=1 Tax=Microbulbifer sp. JMSA008 TaxID=3243373 RepID=UPI004039AB31
MKKLMFIFLCLVSISTQAFDRVNASIDRIYAEDFGFTFLVGNLDGSQQCGGSHFTVYREAKPHFSELYSMALTAFSSGKRVEIVINKCEGNRASVDHMSVYKD